MSLTDFPINPTPSDLIGVLGIDHWDELTIRALMGRDSYAL
jgi:hypothetical protein